jgi:hypothetical protein
VPWGGSAQAPISRSTAAAEFPTFITARFNRSSDTPNFLAQYRTSSCRLIRLASCGYRLPRSSAIVGSYWLQRISGQHRRKLLLLLPHVRLPRARAARDNSVRPFGGSGCGTCPDSERKCATESSPARDRPTRPRRHGRPAETNYSGRKNPSNELAPRA